MAGGGTEFSRKLAGFRLGRGLSQDELARRSGMSVRAIRDLERGQVEHPRRTTIALLSDALSLDGNDREAFAHAAAVPGLAAEDAEAPRTSEAAVHAPTVSGYCGLHRARTRIGVATRPASEPRTSVHGAGDHGCRWKGGSGEDHVGCPCRASDALMVSGWSVVRQLARRRGGGPGPTMCSAGFCAPSASTGKPFPMAPMSASTCTAL